MFKIPVYNQAGKEVEKIELDPEVFDGKVNQDVLYQAVLMYRSNLRKGLASTKTRGEVSGGGVKPWRQKGTGRARVGSIRSPLWRKGGVVFGPHPRDYEFRLPKKVRTVALQSSLNAKIIENNFLILDDLKIDGCKTKEAAKILSNLKLNNKARELERKKGKSSSALIMLDQINNNVRLSFRNISFLDLIKACDVNAYDVLKVQKLIVSLEGLRILVDRIKKSSKTLNSKP